MSDDDRLLILHAELSAALKKAGIDWRCSPAGSYAAIQILEAIDKFPSRPEMPDVALFAAKCLNAAMDYSRHLSAHERKQMAECAAKRADEIITDATKDRQQ